MGEIHDATCADRDGGAAGARRARRRLAQHARCAKLALALLALVTIANAWVHLIRFDREARGFDAGRRTDPLRHAARRAHLGREWRGDAHTSPTGTSAPMHRRVAAGCSRSRSRVMFRNLPVRGARGRPDSRLASPFVREALSLRLRRLRVLLRQRAGAQRGETPRNDLLPASRFERSFETGPWQLWRALPRPAVPPEALEAGRLGKVSLFRAVAPARAFVFLFSDVDGFDPDLAQTAGALAARGTTVVGVDLPQYLRGLAASDDGCHYVVAEIEALSQRLQRELGYERYRSPLLAGVGAGGTLAYAALAQAPAATLGGALSVDPARRPRDAGAAVPRRGLDRRSRPGLRLRAARRASRTPAHRDERAGERRAARARSRRFAAPSLVAAPGEAPGARLAAALAPLLAPDGAEPRAASSRGPAADRDSRAAARRALRRDLLGGRRLARSRQDRRGDPRAARRPRRRRRQPAILLAREDTGPGRARPRRDPRHLSRALGHAQRPADRLLVRRGDPALRLQPPACERARRGGPALAARTRADGALRVPRLGLAARAQGRRTRRAARAAAHRSRARAVRVRRAGRPDAVPRARARSAASGSGPRAAITSTATTRGSRSKYWRAPSAAWRRRATALSVRSRRSRRPRSAPRRP